MRVSFASNVQSIATAIRDKSSSRRASKMSADDQYRRAGQALEHAPSRLDSLVRITVRQGAPFRACDLAGMVHEVAGNQRLLALRLDHHADMTGCMAKCRDQ